MIQYHQHLIDCHLYDYLLDDFYVYAGGFYIMQMTEEQVRKAMECKTADELLALAKSWGVEMTREEAEEYISKMKTAELTEEELKEVAGGFEGPCMKWYCHLNCSDYLCFTKFCPQVDDTCTYCGHCQNYRDEVGTCEKVG